MIDIDDVKQILFILLSHYNIKFDQKIVGKSGIFEVTMLGTKIVYLDGQKFDDKILKNWNIAYIHPDYDVRKAKEKIVWALVKGGYFHYLRHNYKKTFHNILTFEQWDKKLMEERMRRYKEAPKYNYMREINNDAKLESSTFILSIDPGFFDFMND